MDRLQWTLQQDAGVKEEFMGTMEKENNGNGNGGKSKKKKKEDNKTGTKNEQVDVPQEVPDDGQKSYVKRFQVWKAIFIVMSRKPAVIRLTKRKERAKAKQREKSNVKAEDYDYLYKIKELFEDVGIKTDEGSEELNASHMALFFNKVSGWAKVDVTKDLNFENTDDVMAAFSKWEVSKFEKNIGLVIYRSLSDL